MVFREKKGRVRGVWLFDGMFSMDEHREGQRDEVTAPWSQVSDYAPAQTLIAALFNLFLFISVYELKHYIHFFP